WILSLFLSVGAVAQEESFSDLMLKGKVATFEEAAFGNFSNAGRYFSAALNRDPSSSRAKWELLFLDLWPARAEPVDLRVQMILPKSLEISQILKFKKNSNNAEFHYMSAHYANYCGDSFTAIREIEKAVLIDPRNVEFLFWNARFLSDQG